MVDIHLPFFGEDHATLQRELTAWCESELPNPPPERDVDAVCRDMVTRLGAAGWLRYSVPAPYGGLFPQLDSRALCLIRQTLAYYDDLADFSFAIQGLGSGAITLAGSEEQKHTYLSRVASGEAIPAFALSEPDAGSDAAALTTIAIPDGDSYILNGTKTWISQGGIADFYTVFARTELGTGAKGMVALIVPTDTPGLNTDQRIDVIAPHPLATLEFTDCRVPIANRIGEMGQGFKLAMQTLDIFRASVAGAALGFGRRAFDEGLHYAQSRPMFGQNLADFQMTQATLADMLTALESAELLTYRAAWLRDVRGTTNTREVAMAKMQATESAQKVIDSALQMFGGLGVKRGATVERLYRVIRALRIYEGATEVQKLIIARSILRGD